MNILVTSISKKVPLLQEVRKASKKIGERIKLVGADINKSCIGRFFVDDFWEMPHLSDLSIETFIQYCIDNRITAVIPTRDGELEFFAHHREELLEIGIHIMVSNYNSVKLCLDKLQFYLEGAKRNLSVIQTFESLGEIEAESLVIKERHGSGSESLFLNISYAQAKEYSKNIKHPIFQPFIKGKEYSVDMYIDKKGRAKGCIIRSRDVVESGESQVTTTIIDLKLEQFCLQFVSNFSFYGHVVLQIIVDNEENYHVIECNSRFGGASTLSIAAGLDSFYWFLLEASGHSLADYPMIHSSKIMKLVRHPQDLILEVE